MDATPYLALIDFEDTFDTIDQAQLWRVLERQVVEGVYITLLHRLYRQQRGKVRLHRDSRYFDGKRGVKQGDLLSTCLFIAVVEHMRTTDAFEGRRRHRACGALSSRHFSYAPGSCHSSRNLWTADKF